MNAQRVCQRPSQDSTFPLQHLGSSQTEPETIPTYIFTYCIDSANHPIVDKYAIHGVPGYRVLLRENKRHMFKATFGVPFGPA